MIIFCCGMSRSGSTVQYQIARHIAEKYLGGVGIGMSYPNIKKKLFDNAIESNIVVKSEQYIPWARDLLEKDLAIGIGIYRDYRDVVVSLMRFYRIRATYKEKVNRTGAFAQVIKNSGAQALRWQSRWETEKNVTFFRYEDFWPNLERMADNVAKLLNVSLSVSEIAEIEKMFTLDRNSERIDELDDWIDINDSLLTKAHISTNMGKPGQYMNVLTEKQIAIVEKDAGKWLENHGYTTGE